MSGSILDEKIADLNVKFRRGKTGAELDQKQGRVTIEQHLLDYAGIDRELDGCAGRCLLANFASRCRRLDTIIVL